MVYFSWIPGGTGSSSHVSGGGFTFATLDLTCGMRVSSLSQPISVVTSVSSCLHLSCIEMAHCGSVSPSTTGAFALGWGSRYLEDSACLTAMRDLCSRGDGILPLGLKMGNAESLVLHVVISVLQRKHGLGSTHLRDVSFSVQFHPHLPHAQSCCGQLTTLATGTAGLSCSTLFSCGMSVNTPHPSCSVIATRKFLIASHWSHPMTSCCGSCPCWQGPGSMSAA